MKLLISLAPRLSLPRAAIFGVGLMCAAGTAAAQSAQSVLPAANAPLAAHSIGAVPTEGDRPPAVGATARHLLAAQAGGRVAAPGQALYGATASLSWKRYVDTFNHPIPEFFESRVGKKSE
jgi:hypothetical protein